MGNSLIKKGQGLEIIFGMTSAANQIYKPAQTPPIGHSYGGQESKHLHLTIDPGPPFSPSLAMMAKPNSLLATAFWLLIGCRILQVSTHKLKHKSNVYDDQYIGCPKKLSDDIIPELLRREKLNQQFNDAWEIATKKWREMESRLDLPEEFEDNHGIALLVFTNKDQEGNPIHQQFNGNLTIAGASRKAYMDKFQFKALHFYLTRALQILKPDCKKKYTTYRGSRDTFKPSPIFMFERFTAASLDSPEALSFGHESVFAIRTCFGASIAQFSFSPEKREVLISATEKFSYVKKENSNFLLESTGQMCSYFNCAIMGAEKLDNAVCYSDFRNLSPETEKIHDPLRDTDKTIGLPSSKHKVVKKDIDTDSEDFQEIFGLMKETLKNVSTLVISMEDTIFSSPEFTKTARNSQKLDDLKELFGLMKETLKDVHSFVPFFEKTILSQEFTSEDTDDLEDLKELFGLVKKTLKNVNTLVSFSKETMSSQEFTSEDIDDLEDYKILFDSLKKTLKHVKTMLSILKDSLASNQEYTNEDGFKDFKRILDLLKDIIKNSNTLVTAFKDLMSSSYDIINHNTDGEKEYIKVPRHTDEL